MSTLSDIARRTREACNGRIRTTAANWVYNPTPKQRKNCLRIQEDATCTAMYLIEQRGVFCDNPEGHEGKYPQSTSSGCFFIPLAHCRKCPEYRKGGTDGLRYPHCAWAQRERGGDAGAARRQREALQEAVKVANEIMGR